MTDWQPIETAPKDGEDTILFWDGKVVVGFFLDNSRTARPWKGWRLHAGSAWPPGYPTHWMPLPEPPR